MVAFDRGRRRPDPARVREFAETARRLQRERESANDAVSRLLRATPREEWSRLAELPEMRTAGALAQLAEEVKRRLEKEPDEALVLANVATLVAETLASDSYPAIIIAQARAHAWKDRAHALRYLGRHDEALEAVARAEKHLANWGSAAHDLAIVRLVKALILQQVGRFDEAGAIAAGCKEIFQEHGDTQRYLFCGIAEGMSLYRQERFREAEQAFTPLLDEARKDRDLESEARIHNNLGYCAAQLGRLREANIHFSEAVARFTDLGRELEAIRTERGAGIILVNKGNAALGIERLRVARGRFLDKGLVDEAGLCGLTLAEFLLERGDSNGARALVEEIRSQYAGAGLSERAIGAIAYLGNAIDSSEATPATARQVHGYLESLQREPDREFAAH